MKTNKIIYTLAFLSCSFLANHTIAGKDEKELNKEEKSFYEKLKDLGFIKEENKIQNSQENKIQNLQEKNKIEKSEKNKISVLEEAKKEFKLTKKIKGSFSFTKLSEQEKNDYINFIIYGIKNGLKELDLRFFHSVSDNNIFKSIKEDGKDLKKLFFPAGDNFSLFEIFNELRDMKLEFLGVRSDFIDCLGSHDQRKIKLFPQIEKSNLFSNLTELDIQISMFDAYEEDQISIIEKIEDVLPKIKNLKKLSLSLESYNDRKFVLNLPKTVKELTLREIFFMKFGKENNVKKLNLIGLDRTKFYIKNSKFEELKEYFLPFKNLEFLSIRNGKVDDFLTYIVSCLSDRSIFPKFEMVEINGQIFSKKVSSVFSPKKIEKTSSGENKHKKFYDGKDKTKKDDKENEKPKHQNNTFKDVKIKFKQSSGNTQSSNYKKSSKDEDEDEDYDLDEKPFVLEK